jgi:hypothetical protein
MFYITDWSAFNLNARGRKECYSFKSCKSQRLRKQANRKKTVNVSSLAVKVDQRHGVQFVQRNTPAQIFHCLKATNKLVECHSHFIRHHLGLRSDCEADQSKRAYGFSFSTFPYQIKSSTFYKMLISKITSK